MSQEVTAQTAPQEQTTETQDQPVVVKYSPEELTRKLQSTSQEAKSARQKAAELQAKLDAIEQESLKKQGNFEEMAKKAYEAKALAEQSRNADRAKFAVKVLKSEVEKEASKLGCIDTSALLHLIDINQVGIDDEYNVDSQSLRAMLEAEAKNRSYLFQRSAPQPKDMPPASGAPAKQKSIADMTPAERLAYLKAQLAG